ncbi:MAG: pro-sigmaK processing inhibitor BofA family protein [Oscillospiraceae bacterium]
MISAITIVSCIFIFAILGVIYLQNNCLIKGLLVNGATGVGVLYLLNIFGGVTGMAIGFSFYSTMVCWALGLPGVVLLAMIRIIWH